MVPMNETEKNNPEDLCPAQIAYYQNLASNLSRYRNFRWYIPIWTVSFLGAAGAAFSNMDSPPDALRVGATAVILGVAIVSIWQLWNCYTCYGENLAAVRCIEQRYNLPALGLKKWRDHLKKTDLAGLGKQHKALRFIWILLISLVALYVLCCVWPSETRRFLSWLAT